MIHRESLGVVDCGGWPTLSVPCPVETYFWRLIRRCEPDVKAVRVGKGYHNAGWAYIEVEIRALSISKAFEEAARVDAEVMAEFSS